jgi:WD40 repeat protein
MTMSHYLFRALGFPAMAIALLMAGACNKTPAPPDAPSKTDPNAVIEVPPRLSLGPDSNCYGLAFSFDSKTIASAIPKEAELKLWDVTTGKEKATAKILHSIGGVAFSPDGKTIATLFDAGLVEFWDTATGKQLPLKIELPMEGIFPSQIFFGVYSPDGKAFVCGGGIQSPTIVTLKMFDTATGKEKMSFKGHEEPVTAGAFSPDGSLFATGGMDGSSILWDVVTGKPRVTLKGHDSGGKKKRTTRGISAIAFSPDGKLVVSAGLDDHAVKVWTVSTGNEKSSLPFGGIPLHVSFSGDNKFLAIGGQTGETEKPRGETKGEVHLWNVVEGKPCGRIVRGSTPCQVLFSPDGQTLAVTDDKGIHLWDVSKVLP